MCQTRILNGYPHDFKCQTLKTVVEEFLQKIHRSPYRRSVTIGLFYTSFTESDKGWQVGICYEPVLWPHCKNRRRNESEMEPLSEGTLILNRWQYHLNSFRAFRGMWPMASNIPSFCCARKLIRDVKSDGNSCSWVLQSRFPLRVYGQERCTLYDNLLDLRQITFFHNICLPLIS